MFTTIIIQSIDSGVNNIVFRNKVSTSATVEDLERLVQEEKNGMLKNVKFNYLGKTMTDKKKKLVYYKVRNNSTIFCPLRLVGGTQEDKISEYQKKLVSEKTSNSEIKPERIKQLFNEQRLKKQNITLIDGKCPNYTNDSCSNLGKWRFKLSTCECDHPKCYNCLKQYIYKALFINGDTMMECGEKCGEFDFDELSAVLNYGDNDEQLILQALSKNCMKYSNLKCCPNPNCGQYVSKDENIKGNRVRCPSCGSKDFCWKCLKEWTSTNNDDCGDDECKYNFISFTKKALENCKKRDCPHGGVKDIPLMRVCPGCKTLYEWGENCRHITCKNDRCGHNYCQACLRPWESSRKCQCRYCRSVFKDLTTCKLMEVSKCFLAPVQTKLTPEI